MSILNVFTFKSSSNILLQALQSLSLADSRLRQRGMVLVNALGSNACLRKVDLSGNLLEDSGAKMLSKALQINTTLRCVCVILKSALWWERRWISLQIRGETEEVLEDRWKNGIREKINMSGMVWGEDTLRLLRGRTVSSMQCFKDRQGKVSNIGDKVVRLRNWKDKGVNQ